MIPVTLLTGLLGAGKTTWLNRLLPAPPETAVLINEVDLDHLFVETERGLRAFLHAA
jgi:G3E family GTPase